MIHRRASLSIYTVIGTLVLAVAVLTVAPAGAATSMQFASNWQGLPSSGGVWIPSPTSGNVLGAPEGFGSSLCVAAGSSPGAATATFDFTGFSIPGTDIITGVEVRMKWVTEGDHQVQLTDGGSLVGGEHTMPPRLGQGPCDDTDWRTAGGPMDNWGAVLTPAKFNAGDIGFKFNQRVITLSSGDPGSLPVDIDAVELIVYHGPANSPPTASAGGPYSVAEGGSVGLSAAGSSDPDQATATLTFEWDLDNDGLFDNATGISPTFSAAGKDGPDSQTIKVKVTDAGSLSDIAVATVTITNVAPTVGAVSVSPEPSDEGVLVTASASFTDPGVPDTHTCTVDFGAGAGPQPGNVAGNICSLSHTYVDDDPTATASDSYTVAVTVLDDDGGSGSNSTTHQVDNVPPAVGTVTVDIEPSDEGEAVTASAPFTDPGSADTHECTVDYGDGSGPVAGTVAAGTCSGPSHTYVDDNPTGTASDSYTVTVEVTDDDTGSHSNTASHTVNNVAPTVGTVTVSPEPSDEGSAVTASADFTDPGADDTFICTVDYGDGDGPVSGTVSGTTCDGPSHIYADNGSYTVTVEVTDDDTGVDSNDAVHQVDNVDPTITASTNSAEECGDTPEGGLVEVSVDFSDPGFDKPTAGTMEDFDDSEIDWGDGTVEPATVVETPGSEGVPTTGTATGGHMYASGGIFTITVTVTDDDSGSDSIELIALVTGAGLNGGEVQVVGTDFQDVVNVKKKGETIEVMAGFIAAGKVAFPLTDVDKLRVLVCDGDDQVHVNHQLTMPAILEGDAGRDHLQAGSGSTMIEGGADDDHLWGGNADDFIYADEGNDFLFGGRGNDMLFGGPGDDTLFGQHDDDVLDGGAGLDRCNGGRGDDSAANCEAGTPALALGGPATG
jgi:hypothetical protein